MYGEYDIFYNGEIVGKAHLEKEGLYVHYHCVCDFPGDDLFRIYAETINSTVNFGICIPSGNCWKTSGMIPEKCLKTGILKIFAVLCPSSTELFIHIKTGGEFAHIEDLETMHFAQRNNQPGIVHK